MSADESTQVPRRQVGEALVAALGFEPTATVTGAAADQVADTGAAARGRSASAKTVWVKDRVESPDDDDSTNGGSAARPMNDKSEGGTPNDATHMRNGDKRDAASADRSGTRGVDKQSSNGEASARAGGSAAIAAAAKAAAAAKPTVVKTERKGSRPFGDKPGEARSRTGSSGTGSSGTGSPANGSPAAKSTPVDEAPGKTASGNGGPSERAEQKRDDGRSQPGSNGRGGRNRKGQPVQSTNRTSSDDSTKPSATAGRTATEVRVPAFDGDKPTGPPTKPAAGEKTAEVPAQKPDLPDHAPASKPSGDEHWDRHPILAADSSTLTVAADSSMLTVAAPAPAPPTTPAAPPEAKSAGASSGVEVAARSAVNRLDQARSGAGVAAGDLASRVPQLMEQGLRRRQKVRARKVRRVVRHIDPWSVLTFSVIFHLCVFAAMLLASVLVWNAAEAAGTIENIESFIQELGDWTDYEIQGDVVFRAAMIVAGVLTLASSVLLVLLTVVFNLISDLVGGIRMTVVEEETVKVNRHRSQKQ